MSHPAEAPLRVIIADDQASVREGLVPLLGVLPGIEVTAAAADGQQALDLVAARRLPLSQVNDALELLAAHKVRGKLVLDLQG